MREGAELVLDTSSREEIMELYREFKLDICIFPFWVLLNITSHPFFFQFVEISASVGFPVFGHLMTINSFWISFNVT